MRSPGYISAVTVPELYTCPTSLRALESNCLQCQHISTDISEFRTELQASCLQLTALVLLVAQIARQKVRKSATQLISHHMRTLLSGASAAPRIIRFLPNNW